MKHSQHNYQWLFENLSEALNKADTDEAYNRQYQFYVQNSTYVNWPTQFLEELALKYQLVTKLTLSAAQMRQKIANTRITPFVLSAEAAKASWIPLMRHVNTFDPSRLEKFHPNPIPPRTPPKPARTARKAYTPEFRPIKAAKISKASPPEPSSAHNTSAGAHATRASRAVTRIAMQSAPHTPPRLAYASPPPEPHKNNRVGEVVRDIEFAAVSLAQKLEALTKVASFAGINAVYSLIEDNDLQMAFLLDQYVHIPEDKATNSISC